MDATQVTGGGCGPLRQFCEQRVGLVPVDAGVGDALAVDERLAGDELLRAGDEIALDHDADDVAIAGGDLRGHVVADERLAACNPCCCWRGCSRS